MNREYNGSGSFFIFLTIPAIFLIVMGFVVAVIGESLLFGVGLFVLGVLLACTREWLVLAASKRRGLMVFLSTVLVIVLVGGILLSGFGLAGKGPLAFLGVGRITEFPLPDSVDPLGGITTGPDGNLWFTASGDIERMTPTGEFTGFPLPAPSDPSYKFTLGGITTGPDRNVWFTESICFFGDVGCTGSQIERMTPTGRFTGFPLPPNRIVDSITRGPDGNLWFIECVFDKMQTLDFDQCANGNTGNQIGRITPAGKITEFPIPTADGTLAGITTGPDGNLWFTVNSFDAYNCKIGHMTPAGKITEFPVCTFDFVSELGGISTGPDGNLWFSDTMNRSVGRMTLKGQITEFRVPSTNGAPSNITTGPDGNLWFTESVVDESGKIGRITPAGQITEFSFLSIFLVAPLDGITAGPDGNLWFLGCYAGVPACAYPFIGRAVSGK